MLFTAHLLIPLRPILLVMVSRLLALLRPRRRGRRLHNLPLARRPLTRLRTRFGRRLRTHRTRPQGSRQGRHRGAGLLRRLESTGMQDHFSTLK